MRKKFVILAAIAVIIVSVAVTVANMSDGQADVLRYGGTGMTQDIIAQSTISVSEAEETILYYDDNNMDLNLHADPRDNGYVDIGHAVSFTPPTESWTLDKILVVGNLTGYYWGGVFSVEILDDKFNLLYKQTDTNFAYFNDTYKWVEIDIPDQDITGNFSVCFFERGGINVGVAINNPSMRSYLVIRDPKIMYVATWPDINGTEKPFNWMIRAVGRKTS
jgi:hypothetical protein